MNDPNRRSREVARRAQRAVRPRPIIRGLEGWNHFHTETIRGRRGLSTEAPGGVDHFDRAVERAEGFDAPADILRRFYLKVYRFENALLDQSIPGRRPGPDR